MTETVIVGVNVDMKVDVNVDMSVDANLGVNIDVKAVTWVSPSAAYNSASSVCGAAW